ncbi:MAG: hypothetical protein ACKVOH_02150 [Chlamydiales bacterium]
MEKAQVPSTHRPDKFEALLTRIIPASLLARVLFWVLIPVTLLLCHIWTAFIFPTKFSMYLPMLLIVGTLLIARFRTIGLTISYVSLGALFALFYRDLPEQSRLLTMEISLALALTFYIFLLIAEEVEEILRSVSENSKERMNQFLAKNQELTEKEEKWSEAILSLEEEVQKWKEEAEQRRIEKGEIEKKMTLVWSEIELLTSQKNDILAGAMTARREVREQQDFLQMEQISLEKEKMLLHGKMEEITKVADLEEKRKQELAFLREEHEILQQKNLLLERQQTEFMQEKDSLVVQLQALLASSSTTVKQSAHLEERIAELEKQLEKEEGAQEARRERAIAEGLYKQLRSQFEEKSRVLLQARKELFHAQGKVKEWEIEKSLESQAPSCEQTDALEKILDGVVQDYCRMEEEVIYLEDLVTNLLHLY